MAWHCSQPWRIQTEDGARLGGIGSLRWQQRRWKQGRKQGGWMRATKTSQTLARHHTDKAEAETASAPAAEARCGRMVFGCVRFFGACSKLFCLARVLLCIYILYCFLIHWFIYLLIFIWLFIFIFICYLYLYFYLYLFMYVSMYACMYVCMCVCMCVHMLSVDCALARDRIQRNLVIAIGLELSLDWNKTVWLSLAKHQVLH